MLRTVILAAGWWALSEGDEAALAFGAPVILLALLASVSLGSSRSSRWSPVGLLFLVVAFVVRSIRGGVDVAYRALAPNLRIAPTVIDYTLRLPPGSARDLFAGTVSLMPGTLVMNVRGRNLEIHVLVDKGEPSIRELETWEVRVARALGEPLQENSRA